MALDSALLSGRAEGTSPPTLRLYAWERPTLTLGRFQDAATVDLTEAAARCFDVVRRPTGGRAVLHDDELTYSVVASVTDGVPRGVVASYRHFAVALTEAFSLLGIPAEVTHSKHGRASSAACYLATTQADLAVGASKLSGSAQVWEGEAVLQHGSFVVSRDVAAEAAVTRLDVEDTARLAAATCTIEDYISARLIYGEVAEAVARAFERALGVTLEPGEWTEAELATAQDLEPRFRSSL